MEKATEPLNSPPEDLRLRVQDPGPIKQRRRTIRAGISRIWRQGGLGLSRRASAERSGSVQYGRALSRLFLFPFQSLEQVPE